MWKAFYIGSNFYTALTGVILVFCLGVFLPWMIYIGVLGLLALITLTLADGLRLYNTKGATVEAGRQLGERMSNGDDNAVTVTVKHTYPFTCRVMVIDEVPVQFEARHLQWHLTASVEESVRINYVIRPVERGAYYFGALHVFVSTALGLLMRRYSFDRDFEVKVYPSYLQLRKYAFLAFDKRLQMPGQKRMRRLGHTTEFEHIKTYTPGDDTRKINWKATARTGVAMVNQFRDERAQPVYCVIDKGRLMQMPFEGLTLLDYAINTTLVMSYIALRKEDQAGLITFAQRVEDVIKAGRRNNQMYRITEALYKQETVFPEADFERLVAGVSRDIPTRSLLLLFTNFESLQGFQRQLPYLRRMADKHVLVVIFFRNTELDRMLEEKPHSLRDIYHQTIGEKMQQEKHGILTLLRRNGIYGIQCAPEDLTVNTINQYLELKSGGVL